MGAAILEQVVRLKFTALIFTKGAATSAADNGHLS